MKNTFVLVSLLVLSGCATVTRGTTEAFVIETDPPGAKATLTTGQSCTTPCSLEMKRKKEFQVKLEKEGYETVETQILSQIAGAGAAGMAGNVLLGGIIGAGVDAATLVHHPFCNFPGAGRRQAIRYPFAGFIDVNDEGRDEWPVECRIADLCPRWN